MLIESTVVVVLFLFLLLLFHSKLETKTKIEKNARISVSCFSSRRKVTTERSKEEDFSGEISRQGASLPLLLGPICQQLVDMQKGGPSSRRGGKQAAARLLKGSRERNVSKQGRTQEAGARDRRRPMMYGNGARDENGEMYPLDFLGGGVSARGKGTVDTLAVSP